MAKTQCYCIPIGTQYEDSSGHTYLSLFAQPVLLFVANLEHLQRIRLSALKRAVPLAIYTKDMFTTYNDDDSRTAAKVVSADNLDLVGVALRADRKTFDKIFDGLKFHLQAVKETQTTGRKSVDRDS